VRGLTDEEAVGAYEHGGRLFSPRVTRTQRFAFLAIAAVIAIGAVILLAGSRNDEEEAGTAAQATATPTATATQDTAAQATATPEPTRTPRPQPPLIEPGKVTKLRFKQGDRVRFRVRSDQPDEIHVHGYDIEREVGPEAVVVTFPATITGIFEIELHESEEQIAQLRVDP
jgi:type IV secretory pathway VirB10-like protein